MIESLIFWKKYIAISYFDNFRNPEYILKTRPHLFEINDMIIYLCKDKSQLENIFLMYLINIL